MVISIITVIISFLTLLGFGVFMRNFVDDKHDEKKLNRKLANEKARKERLDEIREVLRSEIKNEVVPLHEEMKTISENVSSIGKTINLLKESVVALDRIVMKMNLDLYKDRGYINSSDRAAWNELFHNLSRLLPCSDLCEVLV